MRWICSPQWLVGGALVAALSSCGGKDYSDAPQVAVCPPELSDVTWSNHVQPTMTTWCTGCHHSDKEEASRQGAPVGVDFDTLDGTRQWAERIVARTTGDSPSMPPAGGVSLESQQRLIEWVSCGMAGTEVPEVELCAGDTVASPGDVVLQDPADVADFCASYSAVGGDLVVEGVGPWQLDCVCGVDGSVRIEASPATDVSLPNLSSVGADVVATANSDLTRLDLSTVISIGGSLLLSENPSLVDLPVDDLEDVGGDLSIVANDALFQAWITRVMSVGGTLEVRDNAAMDRVSLDRVLTVGGSLLLEDNPELTQIFGDAYVLKSVGDDLLIRGNPRLEGLYGFIELEEVGGDLELVGNHQILSMFAFTQLRTLGGHLHITDNDNLGLINGFDFLEEVPLEMVVARNEQLVFLNGFRVLARVGLDGDAADDTHLMLVEDVPNLMSLSGLDALEAVGALHLRNTGMDEIQGIPLLVAASEVRVESNPTLGSLFAFEVANAFHSVVLANNPQLTTFQGVLGQTAMDGEVRFENSPQLDNLFLWPGLDSVQGPITLKATGLGNLAPFTSVTSCGGLSAEDNGALTSLLGLENMDFIDGDLVIRNNPTLADVTALMGLTGISGDFTVSGNDTLSEQDALDLLNAIGAANIGGAIDTSGNNG